jgi:CDP-glucose 4,6-dehydratase
VADLALTPSFWRGRKVLLTGHTGFKGGWLSLLLNRLGAEVTGYALEPATTPSLYADAKLGELGRSIIGDIRDAERLQSALHRSGAEIVFHLAAQALVGTARAEPAETFATNLMGTVNLLDGVRQTPSVRAVVVVTSDKVYDNVEWNWAYRETDRLGGREPYGASKACAEIAVDSYRHAYFGASGTKIATVRAGNIIGGGDWSSDRLVPDAMRAFSSGTPVIIRNPMAVRPWQHVLEPVVGYCRYAQALLSDTPDLPFALNFGPANEDALPVSTVVDRLAALWGTSARWELAPGSQPYEAQLLRVDSALARATLGWQPRWRFDDALKTTVAWYQSVLGGRDARRVSEEQIERYLDA